jgi:hypothetical protein
MHVGFFWLVCRHNKTLLFAIFSQVYPDGQLSSYLDGLPMGSPVDFKHIPFNGTVCCHEERRGVTRKGVRILQFVAQLSIFVVVCFSSQ